MTDGPKCASCQQTLVAGNNVVRVRRPSGFEWTHAGPCQGRIRLPADESVFLETGRLVIETTYRLDTDRPEIDITTLGELPGSRTVPGETKRQHRERLDG